MSGYDAPQITAYGAAPSAPQAAPSDAYLAAPTEGFVMPAEMFAGDPAAPPPVPPRPQPGAPFQLPTTQAPPRAYPGRKRALLCACNYRGAPFALRGCINDAKCMAYCLKMRFGFQDDDIVIMTDDQPNPHLWPTRANMLNAMAQLVAGVQPGDSLFFHYSGHGSQTNDWSGDEVDGYNETLCPCDFKVNGQIIDDEINAVMVNPLPQGVVLHAVIDACHSGSVLDLEYRTEMTPQGASWQNEYNRRPRVYKGTAGGEAIQFGAARDSQTAADTAALSGTVSTGAATFCFIEAVEKLGTDISYGRLLHHMADTLRASVGSAGAGPVAPELPGLLGMLLGAGMQGFGGRGQNPVLSSNVPFDLNRPLSL